MSGLGKRAAGGGVIGSLQGVLGGERVFTADMLQPPASEWPVSAVASIVPEPQSATSTAREYDNDQERAAAFSLRIPQGPPTKMLLRVPGRVGIDPPGETQVLLRLQARPSNGEWSNPQAVGILRMPNNMPQSTSFSILLSSLGVSAGDEAQFLLSRNPASASDTLDGRWLLYELGVNFA